MVHLKFPGPFNADSDNVDKCVMQWHWERAPQRSLLAAAPGSAAAATGKCSKAREVAAIQAILLGALLQQRLPGSGADCRCGAVADDSVAPRGQGAAGFVSLNS